MSKKKSELPHLNPETIFAEHFESIAKAGVWEIDLDTSEIWWSDGVYKMLKHEPQEFELDYERAISFIHPDDRQRSLDHFNEVMENGETYDIQKRLITKGGDLVYVRSRASIIHNDDGKPERLVGIFSDITDLTEVRQKYEEAQAKTKTLLENADGIFWEADAETVQFFYVSPQAEEITGYKPEEWISDPNFWENHLHPDEREEIFSFCSTESQMMRDHTFEYRFRHKDGHYVWFHDRTKVVQKDGKPYRLTGLIVDITREKELSQALEQESKLNEVLIQNLPSLFYLFDEDGNHLLWNKELEKATGYSHDEIAKIKPLDMYEGEENERIRKHIDIVMKEGYTQVEAWLTAKDKTKVPLFFTAATTMYKGKKCVFGNGINISALKKAEQKLVESERKLKALVSEGSDLISIQSEKGEYLYIGPNHEQFKGKKESDLLGSNPMAGVHPDDINRINEDFQKALRSKKVKTEPFRYQNINGEMMWLQSTATNMLDDPAIGGIVVKTTDITSLMVSQKAVEKKQQELQLILDYSLDVICTISKSGEFIRVSAACRDMWGYDPAELEGKPFMNYVCEKDREITQQTADRIQSGEEFTNFENCYIHKDGRNVPVIWSAHWNAELEQMHCVARDATEIKKAEQKLRESEARYRGLYESQTNFVIRTDIYGKFTYMNKKYARVMGLNSDAEDLARYNVMDSICEYHHEKVRDAVSRCIEEPGKVIKVTMDKTNAENDIIHTTWDFVSIPDESGNPVELQCIGNDITEQIQFERELLKSNERFIELNKASSESIYEYNPQTSEFFLGDGFERNFGIKGSDGFNEYEKLFSLIHPDDQDAVDTTFTRAVDAPDKFNWSCSYRFKKSDGNYARVTDRAVILRDENGKAERVIGSLQDVSVPYYYEKIDEIEKELLRNSMEQDANLKEVLDQYLLRLEEVFLGMRASVMLVESNNKLYPVSAPSLSKEYIDFITGLDIGPNQGSCGTAAYFGETIIVSDVQNDKRWVTALEIARKHNIAASWSKPVFSSDGKVTATLALYYEKPKEPNELELYGIDRAEKLLAIVLAKFRYLERIRESNERFEMVSRATRDAIWDYDVINNKLFWADGFKTLFGYDPDETTPSFEFLMSRIHTDDRNRVAEKAKSMITGIDQTGFWDEEYRFQKSDGSYAYVSDRAVFIRAENSKSNDDSPNPAIRAIGAMSDISHRKEYEESLRKLNVQLAQNVKELALSNEELEQFAYIASHDLQEPLRMVDSFLTLLAKKYGDKLDDKAHQYIHFATDGAKRMRHIILDLLEYSRIGKHEKEVEMVSISELVEETLSFNRRIIEEKGAKITFDELPVVSACRSPLLQVIQNLISNALKYSRENVPPQIHVSSFVKDGKRVISVKDNGIGFEQEYADKIFVIFQRLHARDEYEGTGIGLAIVKKIAETLGGSVWVESEEGVGSTFYVSFEEVESNA